MNDLWQLLTKVFARGKVPMKEKKSSKKDRLTELEQMVASQAENIKNLTKEVSSLKRAEEPLLFKDAFELAQTMGWSGTYAEFVEAVKGPRA